MITYVCLGLGISGIALGYFLGWMLMKGYPGIRRERKDDRVCRWIRSRGALAGS